MPTVTRLPGVRFEVQPPPPAIVLPRMDVAAFVGFATNGPLHVPVPVDDPAGFADVFGVDAPLGWDPAAHGEATALLGPAVRAFFRNGGERCWVIRVADPASAETNVFRLPGLVAVGPDGAVVQAALSARAPGSGSDLLEVAATVSPRPVSLRVTAASDPGPAAAGPDGTVAFTAGLVSPADLTAGDTVRVSFAGSDWSLVFAVGSVEARDDAATGAAGLRAVEGSGATACWLRPAIVADGAAAALDDLGAAPPLLARLSPGATGVTDPGALTASLDMPLEHAPPPGTVLRARTDTGVLWLTVAGVTATPDGGTTLTGTAAELAFRPPDPLPVQAAGAYAERLTIGLRASAATGGDWTLTGLGLAAGHAMFAGVLPADVALYDPDAWVAPALAEIVARPRFPLAGPPVPPVQLVPLGAATSAAAALSASHSGAPARVRDGLPALGAGLFLDPALAATGTDTLRADANAIRYQGPGARRLRGIHAVLELEEVTLVAVPDAVGRGWSLATVESPDDSAGGSSPPEGEPSPAPPAGAFADCAPGSAPAPVFVGTPVPSGGAYELSWTGAPAGSTYELEEAEDAGFTTATAVYIGEVPAFSLYGRVRGATWYYRVRTLSPAASPYSATLIVTTGESEDYVLDDASAYAPGELLAVHRALLRMCAARGDLFGVLALPAHYGPGAAAGHAAALRSGPAGPAGPRDPVSGFGALYHPWLHIADAANPLSIRLTPPDGPATGIIAATARATGAWAAPANVSLRDVVAVAEGVGPDADALLAGALVNLARQTPRGFMWLSADTLSEDPDARPIAVRRLLAALRRIAALEGAAYAFEPNGPVLHRAIERTFEGILATMLARGAFAGATAAESYQVDVASPPNTPAAADAGQLIVGLRVAPSRPLEFVTVRVLRTDAGGVEVRTD